MEKPSSKPTLEQKTQAVMEALWLTYYNDTLFAKGVISEETRNRMRILIKQRTAARQS